MGSSVTGLPEMIAKIRELGLSVKTESRAAAAAGAMVIKKQAVANARAANLSETGALIKNIAIKREAKSVAPETEEYHVGVRHGRNARNAKRIARKGADGKIRYQYTNDPWYWWFWELKHKSFFSKKTESRPFIKPAIEAKKDEAIRAMAEKMKQRIAKFIAKNTGR